MRLKTPKIKIFGDDPKALAQLENVMQHEQAIEGALMADCHLGYSMPIGGVVAYEDAISPTGVGFDIACGNMAVKTNILINDINTKEEEHYQSTKRLMREIQKSIEFGVGKKNPTPIDHDLFDDAIWPWLETQKPGLKEKAAEQLGTVGSGNHYVDLLVDDEGYIWVANHFGSRGLGHTIASGFMALAAGRKFADKVAETEDAIVFSTSSDIGNYYIHCMALAGDYAYAGREYVMEQVLGILGAKSDNIVHNHHNFAWHENGKWVVRKGATPLTEELAFIGGSMGDISVIVRGAVTSSSYPLVIDIGAIGSAPHGAGRVMSRTAAAGKFRKMWICSNRECDWASRSMAGNARVFLNEAGEPVALDICPKCGNNKFRKLRMRDKTTASVDWDAERSSLKNRGIVVLGAGADESPAVYKDLATVIAAHDNIIIEYILHPIGVVMAGPDTFDPFRD